MSERESSGGGSLPPLGRLHPTVLVLLFAAVLGLGLALDPVRPAEAGLVAGAVALWVVLSRLPLRRLGGLVLLGPGLLSPFYLLAPWVEGGGPRVLELPFGLGVTAEGLLVPTRIVARGLVCVLAGAGLARAADLTGLAVGLSRIPLLPRVLVVMTVQVLRWVEVLVEETRGIGRAVVLRGGGLALARSLPLVWLPRVQARAERVAAAMEVRGYRGELPDLEPRPLTAADLAALAVGALLCLAAVVVGRAS